MKTDGAQQKQCRTDGRGDTDRPPGQAHQHARDGGKFEYADRPPLHRVEAEVVAGRQRLLNAGNLDQSGKPEHGGKQRGHDNFGDHRYTVILRPAMPVADANARNSRSISDPAGW